MILKRILIRNEQEEGGRFPSRYATTRMYVLLRYVSRRQGASVKLLIAVVVGVCFPFVSYTRAICVQTTMLLGRAHSGLSRIHIVRCSHGFLAVPH